MDDSYGLRGWGKGHKRKLTEMKDLTVHHTNNYLTALTNTKFFFTVSWKLENQNRLRLSVC